MARTDIPRHPAKVRTSQDGTEGLGLDAMYRAEAPRLVRFLRKRLPRTEDPRDFVQEAFARLAGSNPTSLLRNPEAYLQRIVRNLLIDRSRREAKIQTIEFVEELDVGIAPDQDRVIEATDMKRLYRNAVDTLPARTREVFLLSRAEDVGYKYIAARLGISVRTVEWHIAEAIMRIGKALDRE